MEAVITQEQDQNSFVVKPKQARRARDKAARQRRRKRKDDQHKIESAELSQVNSISKRWAENPSSITNDERKILEKYTHLLD